MRGFFTALDSFGYNPGFLIHGELKYKTPTGGIISFLFIIFALYYSFTQSLQFISTMNILSTSRDILAPSNEYTLTSEDMYFGLGFADFNWDEYDFERFSYLTLVVQHVHIEKYTGIRTTRNFTVGECDFDKFISPSRQAQLSDTVLAEKKRRMKFYKCPIGNDFRFNLSPNFFGEGIEFLQVNLHFANLTILDQARDDMFKMRQRVIVVMKNLFIDTNNRSTPYSSYIDSFYNEIDYAYVKKTDIYLSPFEMADDNNLFGVGNFAPVNSEYSDQVNQTIFLPQRSADFFSDITNRTSPIASNNNNPVLSVYKVRFLLNPIYKKTLRSFPKFTDFFAGLSSILSSGLMFLAIFMIKYSNIQGKNGMLQDLYSYESVKNMLLFQNDINDTISNFNKTGRSPKVKVNFILYRK